MIKKILGYLIFLLITVSGMALIYSWVGHVESNSMNIINNNLAQLHNLGIDIPNNLMPNINEVIP